MSAKKIPSTTNGKAPGRVIRVAQLKSPATGKLVCLRVTAEGKIAGARYAKQYGTKRVQAWVEVPATSWKQATAAVRAGKGKKVRAG